MFFIHSFSTVLRPNVCCDRVHPFHFAILYNCVVVLALTENGVTNYAIIVTELMKAQAVNMLFMSVAWFHMSDKKKDLKGPNGNDTERKHIWDDNESLLRSKEIQYAILVSVLLIPLMGMLLFVAPYAYSNYSMFFLCAPALFSIISLVSSLWIQEMHLNDDYGVDAKKIVDRDFFEFTGGRLYASLLVLVFGLCTTMYLMHEHILTCRSFYDFWPSNSIQYDTSFSFLISNGLF